MTETTLLQGTQLAATYKNPVFGTYFADPFVFQHEGIYHALGTGPQVEGVEPGQFPVLRSSNLVDWQPIAMALRTPAGFDEGTFWAPEVAYAGGRFYLYYSVGRGDQGHQIRVAISEAPEGPYEDAGRLTSEDCPFSIDASPYRHSDGEWYLFYAVDFLDGDRPGTGLVVDRLIEMTQLAGQPQVVARATADWQRFQSKRPIYGGEYDWHTLEGPFAVPHNGKIYCLYSGGNWQNESYGVDFVVADHPLGPYLNETKDGPRVLRSKPGQVIGPGHNSVTVGPSGRSEYFVYHAWDAEQTARLMRIDPLVWSVDGPVCDGPSLSEHALI